LLSAITSWSSRRPGGGGAFFSPSFSPYNTNQLYTVSDMTGMYHTTNLDSARRLGKQLGSSNRD
jgi:hypothetical protein